jgi:hypothetical protein
MLRPDPQSFGRKITNTNEREDILLTELGRLLEEEAASSWNL